MHSVPDQPLITDCYMNVDGLTVVSWLPSAMPEGDRVPGSEFFVEYKEAGKHVSLQFLVIVCITLSRAGCF